MCGKANLESAKSGKGGKNHPEETVQRLTLQHAEIGVQCFHLSRDNGTELAIRRNFKKMQVIIIYWKPLFMGLNPVSKRLGDSLPLAIKTFF